MVRPKITIPIPSCQVCESLPAGRRLVAQWHGRKLASFEPFASLGEGHLGRVVEAIEAHTESLAFDTARARARALSRFLTFVSAATIPGVVRLKAALRAKSVGQLDPATAHEIELAFHKQLRDTHRHGSSTLASLIGGTNLALSCLASRGLWPHTLGLPIERIKADEVDVRASLLESIGSPTGRVANLRGADVRKAAALRGLQRIGVETPSSDAELTSALLQGEGHCLEKLKTAARTVFDRCYNAWASMQPGITGVRDTESADLMAWLAQAVNKATSSKRRDHAFERLTTDIFPPTHVGLARFGALLELTYMRGPQSRFLSIDQGAGRTRLNLSLRAVACRVRAALAELDPPDVYPLEALRGLLTPSRLCVGSAATLLMLETGMNTAPTISLPWSQVLPTDDPHWLSVANWKQRAGGSLIEEELAVSRPGEPTSAGAALLKLREMAQRHKCCVGADNETEQRVFDHAAGHVGEARVPTMVRMTPNSLRSAFDAIALSALGTRPVPVPSGIRPSLLMVLRGRSPSVREAQTRAEHKNPDTTHRHYAGRARAAHYAENMTAIHDFQERLEQIAIHNLQLPDSQTTARESAKGVDDAIKTGLGTLCIRPMASEDPMAPPDCTSLESCAKCKRLRVSTAPEDLADLIAFGEHLARNEDWLQAYRPEAWATRWLFWSLLIDEVCRRGARSAWAPNLKMARELQAARPAPSFPPLW